MTRKQEEANPSIWEEEKPSIWWETSLFLCDYRLRGFWKTWLPVVVWVHHDWCVLCGECIKIRWSDLLLHDIENRRMISNTITINSPRRYRFWPMYVCVSFAILMTDRSVDHVLSQMCDLSCTVLWYAARKQFLYPWLQWEEWTQLLKVDCELMLPITLLQVLRVLCRCVRPNGRTAKYYTTHGQYSQAKPSARWFPLAFARRTETLNITTRVVPIHLP